MLEYEISIDNKSLRIREKSGKYEIDLSSRLYNFSKDIIKMLMTIPYRKEFDVFRSQLVRSATSIGAITKSHRPVVTRNFAREFKSVYGKQEKHTTGYACSMIS